MCLVHLNELVNKTNGYISNPPVKMVQNDDNPYAWRIMVQRGQYIQLSFAEYSSGLKVETCKIKIKFIYYKLLIVILAL